MNDEKTFVLRNAAAAASLSVCLREWKALSETGKPLCVTVSQDQGKRSRRQNRRYWAMLETISECAWIGKKQFTKENWHHFFRGEFIGYEELPNGGLMPLSTTGLSPDEFNKYMEKIVQYAAMHFDIEFEP